MSIIDQLIDKGSKQRPLLERLRNSVKPVILYGAGVYAYVLSRYLAANGISISAVMVDAAYKTSERLLGLPVMTTEQATGTFVDYQFVVGAANYPAATDRLAGLGADCIAAVDVPDFLNIPNAFMDGDFVRAHRDSFDEAYRLFGDPLSRETFIAAINCKVNEDPSFIRPFVRPDHLYFSTLAFPLSDKETLLDVGGFDGDSIRDFVGIVKGKYRRIISLEPFGESFTRLNATVQSLGLSNVVALKVGAWDRKTSLSFETKDMNIDNRIAQTGTQHIEVDTIDNILSGLGCGVTLIKMDINGAEFNALSGAAETMQRWRPKIAVKMHVKEDFYRLPLLLKKMNPGIRLYLRQRNFMSMMLVLYGVFDAADS